MGIIIFVHRKNPYYLYASLRQARCSNPNSRIILLGDSTNNKYNFVEHYNIEDYSNSAKRFEKIYRHHSPNNFEFELFCFQRWFIIRDFVEKELGANTGFLYCDTDFLLFDDISNDLKTWSQYDMTICRTGTPCCTYFNVGIIEKFTDLIYGRYSTEEGLKLISSYVIKLRGEKRKYGISDMTAFSVYKNLHSERVLRVDIPINGTCYCHNINDPVDGFVMKGKYMKIIHENGLYYGFLTTGGGEIRFKGLHLQGRAKKIIYKFIQSPYSYYTFILYAWQFIGNQVNKIKNRIIRNI